MNGKSAIGISLGLAGLVAGYGMWHWAVRSGGEGRSARETAAYRPRPAGELTFNLQIAPIIHRHCAPCHRPGQSAPFSLLTYDDARGKARQIAEVTASGFMPPWLPAAGYGEFRHERRLTAEELGMIRQWVDEGAKEGQAASRPEPPSFPQGWQLGTPDLVLSLPDPFVLPADGRDVYRNFVMPVPTTRRQFVAALEFQPDSVNAIHHAFVRVDETGESRRLDLMDATPGIAGMDMPSTARIPEGQFLGWQPGKIPRRSPPGLSWVLEPGADLVLQIHMQPTGKPERIRPEVGLYFTETAPTDAAMTIGLRSYDIDLPPGDTNAVVERRYTVPVSVEVLGVLPHAHYLGRDLQGYALLPDGTRRWLLWIKDWDFNWQGDYQYEQPVRLPAGSTLVMRFTYDNSGNNARNPFDPPRRVRYGVETTDEMGELWFQVLARDASDRSALARDYQPLEWAAIEAFNRHRLEANPGDARAHSQLAQALLSQGRMPDARRHLEEALRHDPTWDQPHYYLGLLYRSQGKLDESRAALEAAIRLNPDHARAHGNLGLLALQSQDLARAESHLRRALELNARDTVARDALGLVLMAQGRREEAEVQFREVLRLQPGDPNAERHLQQLRETRF